MLARIAIGAVVALACSPFAGALTLHVSPGGSDSAAGTEAAPLATLEAAMQRLRESGERTREVRLAPGVHPFEQAVELTAADSGRPGRPLRITGAGPGTLLSGFRGLAPQRWRAVGDPTDLKRIADPGVRSRLVQYPLDPEDRVRLGGISRRGFNVDEQREQPPATLHLGTRRMTVARWPNHEQVRAVKVIDSGPTRNGKQAAWKEFWSTGGHFEIPGTRPARWGASDDIWVNGVFGHSWEWSVNRVKTFGNGGRAVELAFGEVSGIGADDARPPSFFFENVFEELDQPGEYYIDAGRGLLFFVPPESGDNWRKLARLTWCEDPIFDIDGARHVTIGGATIEGVRGNALHISRSMGVVLEDLHIRACSGDGVVVEDSREVHVRGLLAEDLGGRGILLRGGDEKTLRTSGNAVSGSRFVGTGWWDRAFRPAIELVGVGHLVRDCEFAELPHMAIEVKGNDMRIEGCWFHDTCRDFRDMSAIYFNLGESPQQRGSIIRGNLFQNIGIGSDGARGGVYLDNGTMGVSVVDNVFHRVGEGADGWAVMNHGGAHVRVEGNTFIECPVPLHLGYWWATWGKESLPGMRKQWRMVLLSEDTAAHRKRYPELEHFFEEDREFPDTNTFRNNRIANSRRGLIAKRGVSVFGGPRERLQISGNSVVDRVEGISFDARGRPILPGWRPWRSADVSLR